MLFTVCNTPSVFGFLPCALAHGEPTDSRSALVPKTGASESESVTVKVLELGTAKGPDRSTGALEIGPNCCVLDIWPISAPPS